MAKLLKLADNPRSVVYSMIVAALKADPTLNRVIRADAWTTYLDEDLTTAPAPEEALPAIEVLPFGQGASSLTNTEAVSPLGIQVTILTEGTDVRDVLNLWGAIEAALFTGDGSRPLNDAIRAKLAGTAGNRSTFVTLRLTSPAITPTTDPRDKQQMMATGTLTAEMTVRR